MNEHVTYGIFLCMNNSIFLFQGGGGYRRGNSNSYRGQGTPSSAGRGGGRNRGGGTVTKFSEDYDFETANKEIAAELERLSFDHRNGESGSGTVTEGSGDANAKEDCEQSDSPAGSTSGKEQQVEEEYYNKNKSFFDKISSEAADRAQG